MAGYHQRPFTPPPEVNRVLPFGAPLRPDPRQRPEPPQTWVAYRARATTRQGPVTLRSCFQHEPNFCEFDEFRVVPEFTVDGKRSQLGFQHWSGSLKCPVCFDYLQSANVLPCGHTFCRRCIWGMITARQEEYPHIHPRGLFFFCPTCRHKVTVRNYVKYSPMNVALNSMVDSWLRSDDRMEYFKDPTPASSAPLLSTSRHDDVTPADNVLRQRQSATNVRHADVIEDSVHVLRQILLPSPPSRGVNNNVIIEHRNNFNVQRPSRSEGNMTDVNNLVRNETTNAEGVQEITNAMENAALNDIHQYQSLPRRNFRKAFCELRQCASGRLSPEEMSADAQTLLDRIITPSSTALENDFPNLRVEDKIRTLDFYIQSYVAGRKVDRDRISFVLHLLFAAVMSLVLAAGYGSHEPVTYLTILLAIGLFTALPGLVESISQSRLFRTNRNTNTSIQQI